VALRLLETFLPEESRDAVIGDLVELHETEAGTRPVAAYWLFWREAFAALVELQILPERVSAFTPYTRESRMQSFVFDLRHAARVLGRSRAFTSLCVATLAVAIGATTAIFSVVNPVLVRPLPYPDADRLVTVHDRDLDGTPSHMGYATYRDLRRSSRSLAASAAVADWDATVFGDQNAERVAGRRVTWEYFRTLRVRPVVGRDFLETDDIPDSSTLVILGHGLWSRRFGADPALIGREIDINGLRRIVIGVMPASFEDPLEPSAQVWRILGYGEQPWACRTCRHLQVIGRLRPGVAVDAAGRELNDIAVRVARDFPREYGAPGALVYGLQDRVTRAARPILLAILGAVALVLLIAVANVMNLQLARAVRRQGEFAVRAALGAGRARIAQQLLAEALLISLLGGVAGVAVAALVLPTLVAQLPDAMPRIAAIRLDWRVMAFVACIVVAIGVAVALAPAIQAGRRRLFDALRGGGRAVTSLHHRTRSALVVTEVALAMMLLVGAALLGRSLSRLLAVDAGFDESHLVVVGVHAAGRTYTDTGSIIANHERMRAVVRAVPGVVEAGLATQLPMGGNHDRYGVVARDKPPANPELGPSADRYTVTPGFLEAMRIPLRRGRLFTDAESRDTIARVALVSEALAKRLWPGEDAIGKYLQMGGAERPWWQVVGVTGNVRHEGLDAVETLQVYTPERQWFWEESTMTLVVRTAGNPEAMLSQVRAAVASVDPLQPISRLATMEQVINRSMSQRRLGLLLFVTFGLMALLLASAGIYGVLSGSVAERTREFGVRTALGATPGSIVGLVLRQGIGLAGVGLVLGGVAALVLSRYLRALLFGVGAGDPVAVVIGVTTILAVSVVACLVPARRAVRADPMTALRSE
jgi:putative ABC transport system permease protein